MATGRPTSMIVPPNVFDETNGNGTKNILQKKDSNPIGSTNQQKLPIHNLINTHSSSSSIDSAGAKNLQVNGKHSLPMMNSIATISSTTTDSEFESEQEEKYPDDNQLSESNQLSNTNEKQKLTKCDYASQQKNNRNNQEQLSRRMKHFRKLFKSEIAHDDMPELIDSYVCAYQGDILLQGKMYITDRYLCFHSRIISYVTKHVYRWEQIENVTKERVAYIFPTAIGIHLKSPGKKITYASFLQRDQAYDKILSICSRFLDTTSLQDDDDSSYTQGGTLKASIINQRDKSKKSKRDPNYEASNNIEQDEVLQLCLPSDKAVNKVRKTHSMSSKSSDDKRVQQAKKTNSSDKSNILSAKKPKRNENLSNDFNENSIEPNRSSDSSRTQRPQSDTVLLNNSVIHRSSQNLSHRTHSRHRDRTSSPTNRSLTNSNHDSNQPVIISTNDRFLKRYTQILLLSIISIFKLTLEYISLIYRQFKTYPIKTSFILLIFIFILIIHSFYLIKLAYRIENRLQSLHHKWPLSTMKNSLPSL